MNPYRIPGIISECAECLDVQARGCDGECRDCFNDRVLKNVPNRSCDYVYFDGQTCGRNVISLGSIYKHEEERFVVFCKIHESM